MNMQARIDELEKRLARLEGFITNGSLQWATVIKDTAERAVNVSGSFTLKT